MKVRTRFSILISIVSFITVTFFSAYLYLEIQEEVYEVSDFEIADVAESIFSQLEQSSDEKGSLSPPYLGPLMERYWIHVYTASGRTLLATKMKSFADIPAAQSDKPYFVSRLIPHSFLKIPPEEMEDITGDEVKLRVMMVARTINGEQVTVHIAKPVLLLSSELRELFYKFIEGILFTVAFIIVSAYLVAGRTLRPLSTINKKIIKIREQSLNERIPLGKSKDELHALAVSLNSMFDRLEHSFEKQRSFISNAAHELKSPLTILMLRHEEMLANNPEKKVSRALEKQLYTMQRMHKLIRDLLSISRLEQQDAIHRQPVNVSELINEILSDYSEILHGKHIDATTSLENHVISADRDKIYRLLINLIDNGIKYNLENHGWLNIVVNKEKNSLVIKISNSGKTIPADDLPHIFRQFYRVEKSRSQAYGGTGLGLTIALRIVEMHGGTLIVSSQEGTTAFTTTIPFSPAA